MVGRYLDGFTVKQASGASTHVAQPHGKAHARSKPTATMGKIRPIMVKGHERPLTMVKYNREGDLLFTCAKDHTPCVFYSDNGERIGTYKGHCGTVWCVYINCEGLPPQHAAAATARPNPRVARRRHCAARRGPAGRHFLEARSPAARGAGHAAARLCVFEHPAAARRQCSRSTHGSPLARSQSNATSS